MECSIRRVFESAPDQFIALGNTGDFILRSQYEEKKRTKLWIFSALHDKPLDGAWDACQCQPRNGAGLHDLQHTYKDHDMASATQSQSKKVGFIEKRTGDTVFSYSSHSFTSDAETPAFMQEPSYQFYSREFEDDADKNSNRLSENRGLENKNSIGNDMSDDFTGRCHLYKHNGKYSKDQSTSTSKRSAPCSKYDNSNRSDDSFKEDIIGLDETHPLYPLYHNSIPLRHPSVQSSLWQFEHEATTSVRDKNMHMLRP